MKTKLYLLTFLTIVLSSCLKDQVEEITKNYTDEELQILQANLNLPGNTHEYDLVLPEHLGARQVSIEKHLGTLGRVLFYDKRLSANNEISCASCHDPKKAFSDDVALSLGFRGEKTKRNSLALGTMPSFDVHYGSSSNNNRLFWDGRARTVEEQSEQTLADPIEMGSANLNELADELLAEEYYQVLFKKAFPPGSHLSNRNNEAKMLMALDAFVSSIGCFNTRFDQGLSTVKNQEVAFLYFTEEENLGKALFMNHCASCHNLKLSSHNSIAEANNGLEMYYQDAGIGALTSRSEDQGVFKVPMLRNVALTAPYMHDGRFATLEEVIEHYNTGLQNHPNLHSNLKVGNEAKRLNLTQHQKGALVAFLHTLTDTESLAQEKYVDPFK